MAEKKHIEAALSACATRGVPATAVPWTEIRERALAEGPPVRRRRFASRTRLALVFATLTALLVLSTGVLASSGVVNGLFRETVPSFQDTDFGVGLEQERTINGVTVALERAYADQDSVVVGYRIEGLTRRHLGGRNPDSVYPGTKLTDAGDGRYGYLNEYGRDLGPSNSVSEGSEAWVRAFETPEKLEAPGRHRFRFEVWLEAPTQKAWKPVTERFVFDLELPIRPTPTIQVGQTRQVGDLKLTLDRVENSPLGTQAFICFDPPNDERFYMPMVKTGLFDQATGDGVVALKGQGCSKYTYPYEETVYGRPGRYSLTVAEIEAYPRRNPDGRKTEIIPGPWSFNFEVPQQ